MSTLRFVRDNARWLAAGILLTWSSSFGQTYFISLSAGHIRDAFGLSHGEWGGVYTIGTIASALTLVQIGWLADKIRVRALAVFVLAGFIAMCVAMAVNESWFGLIAIIAGLRLCGQGMMSHLALTAMGRWFRAQRGRAIAIASLGFAIGEAFLPMIFVFASAWVGWRGSWILAAISLACFTLPVLLMLLDQERTPQSLAATQSAAGLGGRHWRRDEAMRHWLIWALLPGILAPSFMITALFFHQVHIADVKGWALSDYVTVYPLYSGIAVVCNLFAGQTIDRYGSARLLPVLLLPMSVGLALYGSFQGFWVAWIGLSVIAITQGCSHSVLGSIWAEYYGTNNLGAIRSLVIAFTVAASALGPGVTGWLIDVDIDIESQCIAMAVYLVVVSVFLYFVRRAAEFLRYPG